MSSRIAALLNRSIHFSRAITSAAQLVRVKMVKRGSRLRMLLDAELLLQIQGYICSVVTGILEL